MSRIFTTEFMFFKDTPLVDFQNTIHFESNEKRDKHFLQDNHYQTIQIYQNNFNYIRDRGTLDIQVNYFQFLGVNYCTFLTTWDMRFYAHVLKIEYINDQTTRVHFLIDPVMTYTQGRILETLTNITVLREHLTYDDYKKYLPQLKTNDDILNVTTKKYVKQDVMAYDEFYLLFYSTVDLKKPFGTVNDPTFSTSTGTTYDNLTSPVNIYIVEEISFKTLMITLQDYPWVTQNFTNIVKIPKVFIDENDLQEITLSVKDDYDGIYTLKKGHSKTQIDESLSKTKEELYEIFNIKNEEEAHLFRNGYCDIEFYTWDGKSLQVDVSQLQKNENMQVYYEGVIGFKNEFHYFIEGYKYNRSFLENNLQGNFNKHSSYLNDSITITDFDEVPILVDNYKLALSKNANQRTLEESKLLTNRVKNIFDNSASLTSRFMDGASLISNLNPKDLFGKFTDEYEYYRSQKAQWQDLALTAPTITTQTTGFGFQLAKDIFGITTFFATMDKEEWKKIKLYYKEFGFEVNRPNTSLHNVESMSIANYVKFSGSWTLPNMEIGLIEMLKAQFENGVRLWHDNGSANPMNRDLTYNLWEV